MLNAEIRWAARNVLLDPQRLRVLLQGGLDNALALRTFFAVVLPRARAALARLERLAQRIPDEALRAKALHSLSAKAYHVAGGCILATFLPSGAREHYIDIVAPLETIYDFLDTICDRDPQPGPQASRQLHLALADALDPRRPLHEYYLYGPHGDDGDYLAALVRRVRRRLQRLAGHEELAPYLSEAAQLYADTQTFKHLPSPERVAAFRAWFESMHAGELRWYEFAAGAGSQFHVYGLFYAAFCSRFDLLQETYDAYFPEFAAVHVLLDSFIDQTEDRDHGELNWVECFADSADFTRRMAFLTQRSSEKIGRLPLPSAHRFALRLMTLFYLTHPKVTAQRLGPQAAALLQALAP